jgi:hypothetical protein
VTPPLHPANNKTHQTTTTMPSDYHYPATPSNHFAKTLPSPPHLRTPLHHQRLFFAWWCFILPLKTSITPSKSSEHGFNYSPKCKKHEKRAKGIFIRLQSLKYLPNPFPFRSSLAEEYRTSIQTQCTRSIPRLINLTTNQRTKFPTPT